MVVMVVDADKISYSEFHRWLDTFDPSWKWFIPITKGTATDIRLGDSQNKFKLEWLICKETLIGKMSFSNPYVGKFRIHYTFSTREKAMIAKLKWGHMKPYRT